MDGIIALKKSKAYTDTSIAALPKGVLYKGAVNYFADLPTSGQEIGDCYTVLYAGTSGTTPDGGEYVWGEYEGTEQWIPIGLTREQIQTMIGASVQTETERAEEAENALDDRLDAVESVIPEEASSANKLADKAYVDDSIGIEKERAEAAESVLDGRIDELSVNICKVKDYLFEAWYNQLDYENAYEYFETQEDALSIGGCSSVRNGNFYGRNLDWMYNEQAEFVIHTPRIADRYASVGVAGGFSALTNAFVESGEYSPLYSVLPFKLYDGVNEHGVVASMNTVPLDKGRNRSVPTGENLVTISAVMLVRYILDHFSTALEAVTFVQEHMTVYFPEALHDMGYELHFMVADQNSTYMLEFEENAAIFFQMSGKICATNFHLYQTEPNRDDTYFTPASSDRWDDAVKTNLVTIHACGLERYNLIIRKYNTANTASGMRALMDLLYYTRAYNTSPDYADPAWLTEFVGINGLQADSKASAFAATVADAGARFADRTRTDETPTWQTVHSAVYDVSEKTLSLVVQEDGQALFFRLSFWPSMSLPDVTVSDNGKFLRVVNGIWTTAMVSNANGVSF